jgi:hypothetical protein
MLASIVTANNGIKTFQPSSHRVKVESTVLQYTIVNAFLKFNLDSVLGTLCLPYYYAIFRKKRKTHFIKPNHNTLSIFLQSTNDVRILITAMGSDFFPYCEAR